MEQIFLVHVYMRMKKPSGNNPFQFQFWRNQWRESFPSLLGTSAKPFPTNSPMLSLRKKRQAGWLRECFGAFDLCFSSSSYSLLKLYIYILHRSLQPHTERKMLRRGREC